MITKSVIAADSLPFTYLNQYYTYENINEVSFKINNQIYSFDNFIIESVDNGIEIIFKDLHLFRTDIMRIEVVNKKNKIVKSQAIDNTKNINTDIKLKIKVNTEDVKAVCFISKNEFTLKKICKAIIISPQSEERLLKYSANNVLLHTSGQIVLNDKMDSVTFKIKHPKYFFEMTTINKKIVANRVYKLEKSNTLQVEFVELNNPDKYNFKKEIKLSDTFFEIAIDELITIYQDITFLDENLLNKSVDYEFKDWKVRKYNKLGVEPIGLYSLLMVQSTPLNAKIISDLSKGIRVYLTRYASTKRENYAALKVVLLQSRNDANSNRMNNKDPSLISLEVGGRYYQTPDFHYDLNVKLEELFYAEYNESAVTIDLVKAFTPTVTGTTNFILFEIDKWRLHFLGGLGLIGPTAIPSGSTKMAFDVILGSQLTYKVRGGRLYYGLNYASYTTGNSIYNYTHKALEHKIGFYYLF